VFNERCLLLGPLLEAVYQGQAVDAHVQRQAVFVGYEISAFEYPAFAHGVHLLVIVNERLHYAVSLAGRARADIGHG